MKVKLEALKPDADSSFKILLTPNLNDIFYWHFHPEYEIVYAEADTGIRHIGVNSGHVDPPFRDVDPPAQQVINVRAN